MQHTQLHERHAMAHNGKANAPCCIANLTPRRASRSQSHQPQPCIVLCGHSQCRQPICMTMPGNVNSHKKGFCIAFEAQPAVSGLLWRLRAFNGIYVMKLMWLHLRMAAMNSSNETCPSPSSGSKYRSQAGSTWPDVFLLAM